jgi:hypothetical protein
MSVYQYNIHLIGAPGERRGIKIYEDILTECFPNLVENINHKYQPQI